MQPTRVYLVRHDRIDALYTSTLVRRLVLVNDTSHDSERPRVVTENLPKWWAK